MRTKTLGLNGRTVAAVLAVTLGCCIARAAEPPAPVPTTTPKDPYYAVEKLPDPSTPLKLEVGGLNFAPDGTLFVGTRRGEVWTWRNKQWNRFASGLAECLGTLPVAPGVIVVTQRGEITRTTDTDHDGVADRYENLSSDFAYGGNYHEFNFGAVTDKRGNLYGLLNLQHTNHDPWGGRYMGADIKDRGTAYVVSPAGRYRTFAWGLRSPNGITMNDAGELFCAESQGEFVATNGILHLQDGRFYGHPASLSFKPGFKGDPKTTTIDDLAKMRTPPAVWLPYTRMGKSVTEPRFDTTAGRFGPFAGQIFCGDTTSPIVTRIFLDRVAGEYQGACFPFLTHDLLEGANRFAFGPDGVLYTGLTNRGWAAGTDGVRRIVWSGKVPLEVQKMELTADGFLLTFTKPLAVGAEEASHYAFTRYRYAYHHNYGSDELDKTPVAVKRIDVAPDRRSVRVGLAEVTAGWVYEVQLKDVRADDGSTVRNDMAWYTLNRLRER